MSDRICLLGCRESCQLRSASDVPLCQHLFCGGKSASSGSSTRRLGFSVNVAIVTLRNPGSADGEAGGKGSQAKPLKGSVSSLEGDPQHPAAGKQMGYATERKTLPVFCGKGCVWTLFMCCDVINNHM